MIETYYPWLTELNTITIILRIFLSMFCGGLIGAERGLKGRPAGLRTHILVCLGATLAMLTNQFITDMYGGDPARLGAQVISGIGFLGAGTIVVTGRRQIKGLTTAAGLWASACMGLAIGIGFYTAAIVSFCTIIFVSTLLHHFDRYLLTRSKVLDLYIEFANISCVNNFITMLKDNDLILVEIELSKPRHSTQECVGVITTLRSSTNRLHTEVLELISKMEGIVLMEEV